MNNPAVLAISLTNTFGEYTIEDVTPRYPQGQRVEAVEKPLGSFRQIHNSSIPNGRAQKPKSVTVTTEGRFGSSPEELPIASASRSATDYKFIGIGIGKQKRKTT